MDKYAPAWHIQPLKETRSEKHPEWITGYIKGAKLRFEDKDANDEAYAALGTISYDGCLQDMLTQIRMHNDEAMVTAAALQKIILYRSQHNILETINTVDLTG